MKITPRSGLRLSALAVSLSILTACVSDNEVATSSSVANESASTGNLAIWPTLDIAVKKDPAVEARIQSILAGMTTAQKVAQIIQPEIRDITPEDMRKYGFGSYLNGGGSFPNGDKYATPQDWIALAEAFYQASIDDSQDGSTIPTMWGTDAVHGHNNVIGATLFPHNIGLGATHDPDLIREIADATAKEVLATGIDWVFAPTVATVRDDRWGRTYEGYSEDPEIVRAYAKSIVEGLQGTPGNGLLDQQHVIATTKHFVGDGGTEGGDDQGNNKASEQDLFAIHAQGYVGGLSAGSQTVMASFSLWQGEKVHGSKYLLTDVLKDKMGFDGLVVGDWNAHGQVPGCSNESCATTINAGLDVFMVAGGDSWKQLYYNTIAQVEAGEISMTRLDDAVSRVLRVKLRAGLFDKPSPAHRQLAGDKSLIGSDKHRATARRAVRESLVLLKNNANLLPLSPTQHILVAGDGADNVGKQSGGWSISWQGTGNTNADFPGATSIYAGIAQQVKQAGGSVELATDGKFSHKPDVAIVVFGEEPYAEGNGDINNLEFQRGNKRDLALLKSLQAQGIKTVSVFISGRPMWVNAELNASDAFVAAWLPGTEGAGVADVLLTKANGDIQYDFNGKLSFSWPKSPLQTAVNRGDKDYNPLLPYGFGLKYGEASTLSNTLSETNPGASQQLEALALFELSVKPPYKLIARSGNDTKEMTTSRLNLDALSINSLNRRVQEDARTLTWHGNGSATVNLQTLFPEDLRSYTEQHAALTFDYKLAGAPSAEVQLAMICDPGCDANMDISQHLVVGDWQQFSVDLQCFAKAGADISKVLAPFSLRAASPLQISISDVRLVPNGAANATIRCD